MMAATILVSALALLVAIAALIPPPYKLRHVAGGRYRQNRSFHIAMSDGVKIAVDIWLPPDLEKDARVPTLMRLTRYARMIEPGVLAKLKLFFGATNGAMREAETWGGSRFACLFVDVRGTGASFGSQTVPWSDRELLDTREIIDWIVAQPWSDGQVGTYGISHCGNTAELATACGHPALKGAAALFSDYNTYMLIYPGAVFNEGFTRLWQEMNETLDADDIPKLYGKKGIGALLLRLFARGVQPVDGACGRRLLKQAVEAHKNNTDLLKACRESPFMDDYLDGTGYRYCDISPMGRSQRIEASRVPLMVVTGILDAATTDGALERFSRLSNAQTLYIGPWTHGARQFSDLLLGDKMPDGIGLYPHVESEMLAFFKDCFSDERRIREKRINYYTLGEGVFRTASSPPVTRTMLFYLDENGALRSDSPAPFRVDRQVDYSATTGRENRWYTQLGGGSIRYPHREDTDEKMMTFISEPLKENIRLFGKPGLKLALACTSGDCAVFAYLDVVRQNGAVIYLTEGQLRLGVQTEDYSRESYRCPNSGENTSLSLDLLATSALIPAGDRIRLSVGGHDSSIFKRYPANGDVFMTLSAMNAPLTLHLPVVEAGAQ